MFEIIPAIDLRDGKCVRLYQGDFDRETVFADDPVETARHWAALGASRLHVVDLDGARLGKPRQLGLVNRMAQAVEIPIQLGGGLRTLADIQTAFQVGVERVVLGTAAIGGGDAEHARAFRLACLNNHAGRLLIGLDARDGKLAVGGWKEATRYDVFEFAQRLADEGFQRIVYTDISRDGTLAGPNLEHLKRLVKIGRLAVTASGGIGGFDDLGALAAIGAEGAIVGQALYTGAVNLPEALGRLRSRVAQA
jgi:phosphoribosylformimino-5-aminoimidazole carboxamide ribotide isomerase